MKNILLLCLCLFCISACDQKVKDFSPEGRIKEYLLEKIYTPENDFKYENEQLKKYLSTGDKKYARVEIKENIIENDIFTGKTKLYKTKVIFGPRYWQNPGYSKNIVMVENQIYDMPKDFNKLLRNKKVYVNKSNFANIAKMFIQCAFYPETVITGFEFDDYYDKILNINFPLQIYITTKLLGNQGTLKIIKRTLYFEIFQKQLGEILFITTDVNPESKFEEMYDVKIPHPGMREHFCSELDGNWGK
jgi:ABC-type transport system involved in Fe-S cluster assembly fused permease/ATPase subunit